MNSVHREAAEYQQCDISNIPKLTFIALKFIEFFVKSHTFSSCAITQ